MTYSLLAAIGDATKSFATDLIGSSIFTRTKVTFGVEGSATDVSATNPLPITIISGAGSGLTNTELRASPLPVSGTVAVTGTFFQATQPVSAAALPLPTGASTSANQSTGNTSLASIDTKTPALVSGAVPVVDASLVTLMTANNTKLDTLNTSINTSGPLPQPTLPLNVVLTAGTAVAAKVSLQADAADVGAATPLPSYTPSGVVDIAASFNRPADTTAYAVGDLVSTSTTAAVPLAMVNAVRAAGAALRVERIRVRKTGPSLTNAQFRIHLFRQLPTLTVNDNGVFNVTGTLGVSDIQGYVGSADVTMDRAGVAGASGRAVPSVGSGMTTGPASGTTLYVLVEALAAYTPVSAETFAVTLEGVWA